MTDDTMETIGVNVQFDESDDDGDNEDMYGEERTHQADLSGEDSTDEEMEAQRHAIQAAAAVSLSISQLALSTV